MSIHIRTHSILNTLGRTVFLMSCVLLLAHSTLLHATTLLYTGLTPNGWQVFEHDLTNETSKQLTTSIGDKRTSCVVADTVYFKDSQGMMAAVEEDREIYPFAKDGHCADFIADPEMAVFYFTRLMTNNSQRQSIWSCGLEDEKAKLLLRVSKGSLRQIAISPDGKKLAATHINLSGKERILYFDIDKPREFTYLTPENRVACYPHWLPDNETIVFSYKVGRDNYDLYEVSIVNQELSPLVQTENASEYQSTSDGKGSRIFVEQHTDAGSQIVVFNREGKKQKLINLPHPAKEPHFVRKK